MTCHSVFTGHTSGRMSAFKQGVGVSAGDHASAIPVPVCFGLDHAT